MRDVAAAAIIGLVAATPAIAGDHDPTAGLVLRGVYAHIGISAAHQADQGSLTVGGLPVPGAAYFTQTTVAPSIELGAISDMGIGASVFATGPMTTSNTAAGTLAGAGNLGDETNAFFSVTAHYHVPLGARLTPYFGAGLGYMQSLGTKDGVITGFKVASAGGPVLQAGIDARVDENIAVFADVKRMFISTTATGLFGPYPASAAAKVDPWIVSTGISLGL